MASFRRHPFAVDYRLMCKAFVKAHGNNTSVSLVKKTIFKPMSCKEEEAANG